MSQYALGLSLPASFHPDRFIISDCNRDAFAQVMSDWPSPCLYLWGPARSGKTHLAHIWADSHNISIYQASNLPKPESFHSPWVIDALQDAPCQHTVLHLLNLSKERGISLLLVADKPASALDFTLPDLTSRLKALPSAAIHPPDDELLAGVMRKQFTDRQLKIGDEVIHYCLARMERSFYAVDQMVDRIDSAALILQKPVTIPLVKSLLDPP